MTETKARTGGRPGRAAAAVLGALVVALAGCAKTDVDRPDHRYSKRPPFRGGRQPATQRPYTIAGKRYYPIRDATGFVQEGLASWYGRPFHGRRASSGEIYDMHALTAAHKILPMQTWIKVTSRDTGRFVIVRVNDRGPFIRGRIVDLSFDAAKRLGVVGPGTARVRLEALGYRKQVTTHGRVRRFYVKPASYRRGQFTVQVGAFAQKANADRLAATLKKKYGYSSIRIYDSPQGKFFRVRTTLTTDLAQARAMEKALRLAGFKDAFAVAVD
ncbi:MAG: septal ring lytic transglycosylase RlpA family protein [Proteobacteria bacterium]|nr:septal ring lytic transglycosylase RlpA family protein [Pseudomonadota bacterium]